MQAFVCPCAFVSLEWLGYMVGICLPLYEATRLFTEWLYCILTSSERVSDPPLACQHFVGETFLILVILGGVSKLVLNFFLTANDVMCIHVLFVTLSDVVQGFWQVSSGLFVLLSIRSSLMLHICWIYFAGISPSL